MAYETLKSIITQNIKTNGQESITGMVLQQILLQMVDELGYTPEGDLATKEWVNTQLADYASKTWVTNQLGSYLPLTGGTLTGRLNVGGAPTGSEYGIYTPWDIYAGEGLTSAGRIYLTGENVDLLEIRVEGGAVGSVVRNSFGISTDDNTLNNNYWLTRCMNIVSKFKVGWTNNNDNTFFANAETGRVGIGTSSPSYKLDVSGQVGATGFIKSGGTSDQVLCADGSVKTLAELKAALNAI